jgi:hypothetical protein
VTLPMARSLELLNVAAQKTFSSLRTSYAKRGRVLLSVGRAITANYWGDRLAIPQILFCTLLYRLRLAVRSLRA